MKVELSRSEVEILVQSLSNCIATCRTHGAKAAAKCPDCDSARTVKARLQRAARSRPAAKAKAPARARAKA